MSIQVNQLIKNYGSYIRIQECGHVLPTELFADYCIFKYKKNEDFRCHLHTTNKTIHTSKAIIDKNWGSIIEKLTIKQFTVKDLSAEEFLICMMMKLEMNGSDSNKQELTLEIIHKFHELILMSAKSNEKLTSDLIQSIKEKDDEIFLLNKSSKYHEVSATISDIKNKILADENERLLNALIQKIDTDSISEDLLSELSDMDKIDNELKANIFPLESKSKTPSFIQAVPEDQLRYGNLKCWLDHDLTIDKDHGAITFITHVHSKFGLMKWKQVEIISESIDSHHFESRFQSLSLKDRQEYLFRDLGIHDIQGKERSKVWILSIKKINNMFEEILKKGMNGNIFADKKDNSFTWAQKQMFKYLDIDFEETQNCLTPTFSSRALTRFV